MTFTRFLSSSWTISEPRQRRLQPYTTALPLPPQPAPHLPVPLTSTDGPDTISVQIQYH